MTFSFYKYQGTGNDFVVIDNREGAYSFTKDEVASICHRRFGIGADGLMLLQNRKDYDFEMVYYNADGAEGSMCGNGGRCLVRFAADLGIIQNRCRFLAVDGEHEAAVNPDGTVGLKMIDVNGISRDGDAFVLNTGSPHYVRSTTELEKVDVFTEGRAVRYSGAYAGEGINVNFVKPINGVLHVRTYERGVEDETYSCGTGVTAVALVYGDREGQNDISLQTKGGPLKVTFDKTPAGFRNIWLIGPAEKVFEGKFSI